MNYWLTTHWPPVLDSTDKTPSGIYVQNGKEKAGEDLLPGDKVLIYQSLKGRDIIRRTADGIKKRVKSRLGRKGIVVIAEATEKLTDDPESIKTEYWGGETRWWRWYAETRVISENGFVPLKDVNRVLGYKENNVLHGFGDRKSGLKKITEAEYNEFIDIFKKNIPSRPTIEKLKKKYGSFSGKHDGVGESNEHLHLKEYIASDPSVALGERGLKTKGIEYKFPTGDRADLVLEDNEGRIIGLEVEVIAEEDQWVGIYQAIKYRYMLALDDERKYSETRAMLVAYSLSPDIKKVCKEYDVECFVIDEIKVKNWVEKRDGK